MSRKRKTRKASNISSAKNVVNVKVDLSRRAINRKPLERSMMNPAGLRGLPYMGSTTVINQPPSNDLSLLFAHQLMLKNIKDEGRALKQEMPQHRNQVDEDTRNIAREFPRPSTTSYDSDSFGPSRGGEFAFRNPAYQRFWNEGDPESTLPLFSPINSPMSIDDRRRPQSDTTMEETPPNLSLDEIIEASKQDSSPSYKDDSVNSPDYYSRKLKKYSDNIDYPPDKSRQSAAKGKLRNLAGSVAAMTGNNELAVLSAQSVPRGRGSDAYYSRLRSQIQESIGSLPSTSIGTLPSATTGRVISSKAGSAPVKTRLP